MRGLEERVATGALKLEELQHPPLIGGRKRRKEKKGNEREKKGQKHCDLHQGKKVTKQRHSRFAANHCYTTDLLRTAKPVV